MASFIAGWMVGLAVVGLETETGAVALREQGKAGDSTRVVVALKADGLYRPGPPPGVKTDAASKPARPLALRVEMRLDFAERIVEADASGRPRRSARRVVRAASAINGEVRPTSSVLRPEVALLVAELRATGSGVVVTSPSGPLTRPELEVVQGVGDPLMLPALLPEKPVSEGDRWRLGAEAVKALSGYDTLASDSLEARLESLDDGSARVHLAGEVRGSVLGGEGTIACDGSFTFDRKAGRVDRLTLTRTEARKPGPVEAGLEVKSTLTIDRKGLEAAPVELSDAVVAGLPREGDPQREDLLLISPSGKYTLRHDRDWHTYWDDARLTVLKRLARDKDKGEVIAQCNLATGPNAGKGRHQDPEQFRDDVRRALGPRFGEFLGEGEVEGDPAGGYRYKVGVQGREGELGVVWYYLLAAGPDGDQLLATFTLAADHTKPFADQDLRLIGSLRWSEK